MKFVYALKYMESFAPAESGIGFSNQRLSELCSKLGRVNIGSGYIHVPGGGAGHGCVRMIESVIRKAGYKVGLITAVNAFDVRSTVFVDGSIPSIDDFNRITTVIKQTVGKENKDRYSKEEIVIAYSLLVCKLEGCNFVIFEDSCELYGMFSVCMPFDIAVVPTVYGERPPEAYFSALKQRTREVVSGDQRQEIHSRLTDICAKEGIRLNFPMRSQLEINFSSCRSIEFSYKGKSGYVLHSSSYMLRDCAMTAIEVAHAIRRAGIKLAGGAIVEGLADVSDAGCFAMLSSSPTVITDISTYQGEICLLAENLSVLPEAVKLGKKTLCFCADSIERVEEIIKVFKDENFDQVLLVSQNISCDAELFEGCLILPDIETAAKTVARSSEPDRTYLCFGEVGFAEKMKTKISEVIGGF